MLTAKCTPPTLHHTREYTCHRLSRGLCNGHRNQKQCQALPDESYLQPRQLSADGHQSSAWHVGRRMLAFMAPALVIPLGDPLMTLTDTIFIGQVCRCCLQHGQVKPQHWPRGVQPPAHVLYCCSDSCTENTMMTNTAGHDVSNG